MTTMILWKEVVKLVSEINRSMFVLLLCKENRSWLSNKPVNCVISKQVSTLKLINGRSNLQIWNDFSLNCALLYADFNLLSGWWHVMSYTDMLYNCAVLCCIFMCNLTTWRCLCFPTVQPLQQGLQARGTLGHPYPSMPPGYQNLAGPGIPGSQVPDAAGSQQYPQVLRCR